jgi:hypothetical protein
VSLKRRLVGEIRKEIDLREPMWADELEMVLIYNKLLGLTGISPIQLGIDCAMPVGSFWDVLYRTSINTE